MAEIQVQKITSKEVENEDAKEKNNDVANDLILATPLDDEEENGNEKVARNAAADVSRYDIPPDGGHGWIIVITTFFGQVISTYNLLITGVLLVPLKEEFNVNYANLNLMISLRIGAYYLAAPLASMFGNRFGSRLTVIVGGILQALGVGLAAFAPSIIFIHITLGLISGIGFSFCYPPMTVEVAKYFTTKRSLAFAISHTGLSAGAIISPIVTQYLIDSYGLRGTLLIQSAIVSNLIPIGALLRPINLKLDDNAKKRKLLDTTLLKSKEFMLYLVTDGLVRPANSFFSFYIMAYGVLEQGYTDYQAVLLRSTASFVGLTARPILGMLTVFFQTNCFAIMAVQICVMALSYVIYPFLTSYWASLMLFGIYGFCFSGYILLFTTGLSFITGPNKLMSAYGWKGLMHAPLGLLLPPVAGWLSDTYGTLRAAFWLAFGMLSLAFTSIVTFSLLYSKKYKTDPSAKDKK